MAVYTATKYTDASLALEFQQHFSNESHKNRNIYHKRRKKMSSLKVDKQGVSFVTE